MEETILHELVYITEQLYIILKEGGFRHKEATLRGMLCGHMNTEDDDKPTKPVVLTAYKYGYHGELYVRRLSAFLISAKRKNTTLDFSQLWR